MSELRLVENPERALDTRKHFISLFNKAFKDSHNRDNPLPFSACMRAMQGRFKFEDEETGEIIIEYPTEDAWKEQIDGMFNDEFCKKNKIFDFPYFLKQFGRFKIVEKKEPLKPRIITVPCDNCGSQRPPLGLCPKCGV
jgi:hypothetical protein